MDHKLEFFLLLLEDSRSWPFVERRVFKESPPVFRCKKGISFEKKFFDEFYGAREDFVSFLQSTVRISSRVSTHDNCVGLSL